MWRSVVTRAIGAAVTATSLKSLTLSESEGLYATLCAERQSRERILRRRINGRAAALPAGRARLPPRRLWEGEPPRRRSEPPRIQARRSRIVQGDSVKSRSGPDPRRSGSSTIPTLPTCTTNRRGSRPTAGGPWSSVTAKAKTSSTTSRGQNPGAEARRRSALRRAASSRTA
jgi:hypothetical protein